MGQLRSGHHATRGRLIAVTAVWVALAACGTRDHAIAPPATVTSLVESPSGANYAYGRTISGEPGSTGGDVGSATGPAMSPIATRGLGGTLYVGRTDEGEERTSSDLRLLREGQDTLVLVGVETFAIRHDGALAAARPTARGFEVVLLNNLEAHPTQVTSSEEHLVVKGWAGDVLLIEEQFGDAGPPPLLFSAVIGGAPTLLARNAGVAAISPDGARMLIDQVTADGRNVSKVLEVASGKELGRVDVGAGPTGIILGQASWTRLGVAAAGFVDGAGFAVWLAEDGNDLVLTDFAPLGPGLFNGLNEPYQTSDPDEMRGWSVDATILPDASDVVASATDVLITCSRLRHTCVREGPIGLPNLQTGRVRNASRSATTGTSLRPEEA